MRRKGKRTRGKADTMVRNSVASTNYRFCKMLRKLRHFCNSNVTFAIFKYYSVIEALLNRIGKKLKSLASVFYIVECGKVANSLLSKFSVRFVSPRERN